jgi:hypothetical protein
MTNLRGLIIRPPYIDYILSGRKTWEMRSTVIRMRETIALIRKGSKRIEGIVDLVDCLGPFTYDQMLANQSNHMISTSDLANPKFAMWNHAWVLNNVRPLRNPVPYTHVSGQQQWVRLDPATVEAVQANL